MEHNDRIGTSEAGTTGLDRKRRTGFIAAVAVLLVVSVALIIARKVSSDEPQKKRVVHQITLLKPPPPPPPKPEEKPPEPVKKEEVKLDEPKQEQPEKNEAPEARQLGLDADGAAGGDAFGLAANKGGRGLIGGGGSNRAKFAWYTSGVEQAIRDALARNRKLQSDDYRIVIRVWLDHDGGLKRVELVGSSGKAATDEAIKLALGEIKLKEPPEDLPQPLKLRITSRL